MQYVSMDAVLGGCFIGAASGVYMILAHRIAGNSGALQSLVVGPPDPPKIAYLLGLCITGSAMGFISPSSFDPPPVASLSLFLSGLVIGVGTYLGNGCTSGHGLCGLSRYSARSLVAVPTFMGTAIVSATARTGMDFGPMVIPRPLTRETVGLVFIVGVALAVSLLPALAFKRSPFRDTYIGCWSGTCFAFGLTVGGMVRPSVVQNALCPHHFDLTLWILFGTALVCTFAFYRLAQNMLHMPEACPPRGGKIDKKLVIGSILFGAGWGFSGFCPGPLVVAVGADPASLGTLLTLLGAMNGMQLAARCSLAMSPVANGAPSTSDASKEQRAPLKK